MLEIEIVDNVIKKWASICSPIYVKNPKEKYSALSIGTGFLIRHKNAIFFITAYHVLEEIKLSDFVFVNFNEQSISLESVSFLFDKVHDIALAHLSDDWLKNNKITSIKAIELIKVYDERGSLNLHFLVGYPSSKNKLSKNFDKINRYVYGYALYDRMENTYSNTKLNNPVVFSYDTNNAYNNVRENQKPPSLKGTSGSPIFEISINQSQESVQVSLAGVFLEWHEKRKEVIGTSVESLIEVVEKLCENR